MLSILLFTVSACQLSSTVNSDVVVAATNGNDNKTENRQPEASPKPKPNVNPTKIKSEYPLLWETTIRYNDFTDTQTSLSLFSYDENQFEKPDDKNSPYYQARSGVEVDLMNCGGYLASGRLYSSQEESNFPTPDWMVKIASETVAKDVEAKIKRCNIYTENGMPSRDEIGSKVFAVAPRKNERRNITVREVDTKKVFRSLPKTTREFLNTKAALAAGRKKDDLSHQDDIWTDLDGDGKIDLITISAMYDEEHSSGTVLLLVNGKWKVIGSVRD